MAGFQWVSGVLASTAFAGAVAAAEPFVTPEWMSKDDPRRVCFLEHKSPLSPEHGETEQIKTERREACLTLVEATQLIKQGKTKEGLDLMSRMPKSKPASP